MDSILGVVKGIQLIDLAYLSPKVVLGNDDSIRVGKSEECHLSPAPWNKLGESGVIN